MVSSEGEPNNQKPVTQSLEAQRALVGKMLETSPGDIDLLETLMNIDSEIAQRKRASGIPADQELIDALMINDQY